MRLDDDLFPRISTRITRTVFLRFKRECDLRTVKGAARVPIGTIITELGMSHLTPCPEETESLKEDPPKRALKAIGRKAIGRSA